MDKSIQVPIKLGNGSIVMTAGKGDITVMTSCGKKTIKNVFLVPGLEKNLLSVPQIISSGYQIYFQNKKCIIPDAYGKKTMEIPMTHKSFRIKMSYVFEEAMNANKQEENKRWNWDKQEEAEKTIVVSVENNPPPKDQPVSISSPTLPSNENHAHIEEEEGETSEPPKKYRSMSECLQEAPRVEFEEAAQTIEVCLVAHEEPQTYDKASDSKEWRKAMTEEIEMIEKNKTWELVDKPEKKKVINVKWIYKIKTHANGNQVKDKARLVARGFSQEYGVDYLETFVPVSRYETIRAIFAYTAQMKWRLYLMDVKSAFLNGELKEDVYVTQPPGFVIEGKEEKVLRLHKALYGVKQVPRTWYARMDSYFIQNGFERSMNDAALYIMKQEGDVLIVSLYVDDIIITGNNIRLINTFKGEDQLTDLLTKGLSVSRFEDLREKLGVQQIFD
ncbi:unnamed protein product [Microthlaspi erraticum]|uniref:Uncharacterized protein n=1 Tax=Microthlaspi erraticum TaxID=1685480 RepID=A0A6D2IF04_9BRAS|nr:unnamed protein product [Microthlaspi erraticum]